jgi:hypothetical protein
VKTLHPKVHGGILARRDLPEHMQALEQHGIPTIDLLVVNLYPFVATIAKDDCTLADAIENIDIGGPTMLRSAAKNHRDVTVVVDPADYAVVLDEMKANGNAIGYATNFRLATKVFAHTAQYDGAITNYLTSLTDELQHASRSTYPATLNLAFDKVQDLRYGENPHQSAAFYRDLAAPAGALANYRQLQGKELSYNNIADSDAAWECVKTFDAPACVIIKHANPCGVAVGNDPADAYAKAFQTDPTSAFGGIIAFNREVDEAAAQAVAKQFVEVLIAPSFSAAAQQVFAAKQNVRLLEIALGDGHNAFDLKRVGGGLLVQSLDSRNVQPSARRHEAPAEREGNGRPAVRLARREVREVERHRVLRQRHDAGRRRRPDEPRRLRAHRQHQGAERGPHAGRLGRGVGCVLPVPRRSRRGGRGRDLRDPAGRLDARRRSDRGGRRARHRDGADGRASLPSLIARGPCGRGSRTRRQPARRVFARRRCTLSCGRRRAPFVVVSLHPVFPHSCEFSASTPACASPASA